jgi:hypothetical protein
MRRQAAEVASVAGQSMQAEYRGIGSSQVLRHLQAKAIFGVQEAAQLLHSDLNQKR